MGTKLWPRKAQFLWGQQKVFVKYLMQTQNPTWIYRYKKKETLESGFSYVNIDVLNLFTVNFSLKLSLHWDSRFCPTLSSWQKEQPSRTSRTQTEYWLEGMKPQRARELCRHSALCISTGFQKKRSSPLTLGLQNFPNWLVHSIQLSLNLRPRIYFSYTLLGYTVTFLILTKGVH